jgi:hypothetical protein
MNTQFDFRGELLKIQDLLSDNDRHRLHFVLGEDVPRYLRDDLSLSGTLRLLDSLVEKAFISDEDCHYLIEAFNKIHCRDAVKRLQGLFFSFFLLRIILNDHSIPFRVSTNSATKQSKNFITSRYSFRRQWRGQDTLDKFVTIGCDILCIIRSFFRNHAGHCWFNIGFRSLEVAYRYQPQKQSIYLITTCR